MRMNLLMRLVTPDPEKGDRPFDQRPYGRLRLTEPMARRLQEMVKFEIDYLRNERRMAMADHDCSMSDVEKIEADLKITRKIGENLSGLREEKRWTY